MELIKKNKVFGQFSCTENCFQLMETGALIFDTGDPQHVVAV